MKPKIFHVVIVFMLSTLFFSMHAFAQAHADSSEALLKTKKRENSFFSIDTLKIKLALTAEQETKVREIIDGNREKMKQERELYKDIASAQARLIKQHFDKTDKEIFAVLSAEQKKKYDQFKKEFFAQKDSQRQRTRTKPATTP